MALERRHLEHLAAHGLLVSERFPPESVCPGGFLMCKGRRDGTATSGNELWIGSPALIPTNVPQLSEATDLGTRARKTLGYEIPIFAVEGVKLWVHEEAGRWLVYDGDVSFPGGIVPTFRWEFDTPEAAVDAILSFFGR
jgi:hypothetical protein